VHSIDGVLDDNDTFTQDDIDSGRLKYVQDTSETTSDSFTFDVSDGDTGSITNLSMPIVINPTNDDPDLDTNATLTLAENAFAPITTSYLSASDVDVLPAVQTLRFTVDDPPSDGELRVNGGPVLAANDWFTQDDIEAGWVVYTHLGAENASDSFDFILGDGTSTLPVDTFDFTITPVNDIPELDTNVRAGMLENATLQIDDNLLVYTDAESATTAITYSVSGANLPLYGDLWVNGVLQVASASFTQFQIDNDLVEYVQDGSEVVFDSFTFSVSDDNAPPGVAAADVFEIDITNVNDTPRELANLGRLLDEGETVEIRTGDLEYTDDDHTDPADVIFKITDIPDYGTLYVGLVPVIQDATFTQFQINDSQITY